MLALRWIQDYKPNTFYIHFNLKSPKMITQLREIIIKTKEKRNTSGELLKGLSMFKSIYSKLIQAIMEFFLI